MSIQSRREGGRSITMAIFMCLITCYKWFCKTMFGIEVNDRTVSWRHIKRWTLYHFSSNLARDMLYIYRVFCSCSFQNYTDRLRTLGVFNSWSNKIPFGLAISKEEFGLEGTAISALRFSLALLAAIYNIALKDTHPANYDFAFSTLKICCLQVIMISSSLFALGRLFLGQVMPN